MTTIKVYDPESIAHLSTGRIITDAGNYVGNAIALAGSEHGGVYGQVTREGTTTILFGDGSVGVLVLSEKPSTPVCPNCGTYDLTEDASADYPYTCLGCGIRFALDDEGNAYVQELTQNTGGMRSQIMAWCTNCGREFTLADVRYSVDGTAYCPDCGSSEVSAQDDSEYPYDEPPHHDDMSDVPMPHELADDERHLSPI